MFLRKVTIYINLVIHLKTSDTIYDLQDIRETKLTSIQIRLKVESYLWKHVVFDVKTHLNWYLDKIDGRQ